MDRITYCDVNTCEDCPRYGDDCDGDKRLEHTDYINRADAVKAIEEETYEAWTESDADFNRGMEMAVSIIKALPSTDMLKGGEDK